MLNVERDLFEETLERSVFWNELIYFYSFLGKFEVKLSKVHMPEKDFV